MTKSEGVRAQRVRSLRQLRRRLPPAVAGPIINLGRLTRTVVAKETLNLRDLATLHETHLVNDRMRMDWDRSLVHRYRDLLPDHSQRTIMWTKEARVRSQNGEDGILLYLLSIVGIGSRAAIDIGSAGWSSIIGNLTVNFGFRGVFVDGDVPGLEEQCARLSKQMEGSSGRVEARPAWITPENIGRLVAEWSGGAEVDVLSLDIDSLDYWVLDALDTSPSRILVAEYNASFGPTQALTVPQDPSFERWAAHPSGWYYGASLAALTKAAGGLGYALVGCESSGVNAFFVRRDLLGADLVEVSPSLAFWPDVRRVKMSQGEQEALLRSLRPVEV